MAVYASEKVGPRGSKGVQRARHNHGPVLGSPPWLSCKKGAEQNDTTNVARDPSREGLTKGGISELGLEGRIGVFQGRESRDV